MTPISAQPVATSLPQFMVSGAAAPGGDDFRQSLESAERSSSTASQGPHEAHQSGSKCKAEAGRSAKAKRIPDDEPATVATAQNGAAPQVQITAAPQPNSDGTLSRSLIGEQVTTPGTLDASLSLGMQRSSSGSDRVLANPSMTSGNAIDGAIANASGALDLSAEQAAPDQAQILEISNEEESSTSLRPPTAPDENGIREGHVPKEPSFAYSDATKAQPLSTFPIAANAVSSASLPVARGADAADTDAIREVDEDCRSGSAGDKVSPPRDHYAHSSTAPTPEPRRSHPLDTIQDQTVNTGRENTNPPATPALSSDTGSDRSHKNFEGGPTHRETDRERDANEDSKASGAASITEHLNAVAKAESHTLSQSVRGVASETAGTGTISPGNSSPAPLDGATASPSQSQSRVSARSAESFADAQAASSSSAPVVINAARLVERIHDSGVNLSMRTADFGDLAIHTAISHERLSAQISVEHSDLGRAIAGEVPALQQKLNQEHGLQATIEVQSQSHSSGGSGGQSQQQPVWRPPAYFASQASNEPSENTTAAAIPVSEGRVDIRI